MIAWVRRPLLVGHRSGRRFIHNLSSIEIRNRFTQFFEAQGHKAVPSASLIPHNDKSLLFTNAGMVPFKDYFLHPETAPFQCAVSVQKCMRAGGKHNDLDQVGYTPRHHTFFEMLGNFSFGEYGKKEAIEFAWKFLTHELGLPVERLRVSVLHGDNEGYTLWKNMGLSDDKIVLCGPEDNFWSMGDGEGPCGPCTEIFWDTGNISAGEDRWLEIWNLVFMEKLRTKNGDIVDLSVPCIDTGMGLERIASVLQGKQTNFETDAFRPLFVGLQGVLQTKGADTRLALPDNPSTHAKIIADHLRSMCFLIADGVVPSNVGRGYVLRRIIRRALRSARHIGLCDPFLTSLYPDLLTTFGDDRYPELATRASSIQNVIVNEERAFLSTLDRGLALLDGVFSQSDLAATRTIPPAVAFQLYDTFGFPLDLTWNIAHERGWNVDWKAVEELQKKQKAMGKESWKKNEAHQPAHWGVWRQQGIMPQFSGYDHNLLDHPSRVLAMQSVEQRGKKMLEVMVDPCPFYGRGGGQVPDRGIVRTQHGTALRVLDALEPYDNGVILRLEVPQGSGETLQVGDTVSVQVDTAHRQGTEIHHTATHLVNAGIRSVLGADIVQAGSLVEPKKLRFDFAFGRPISSTEIEAIEGWVNQVASQNIDTVTKTMPWTDAVGSGAIADFSERYGDEVRVVEVPGFSKELCGGTHARNVRELFPFKIVSESSVAAGTRRIEAVAGPACLEWYQQAHAPVATILSALRANSTAEAADKINKMLQQNKELQKRLEMMTDKLASSSPVLPPIQTTFQGTPMHIHWIDDTDLDAGFLKKRAKVLRETQSDILHVLVHGYNVVATVGPELAKSAPANMVLKHVFERTKGRGGGQADFAQGRLSSLPHQQTLVEALTA